MGLLANPDAALPAVGFTVWDDRRARRSGWLSFAVVALLHVAGLYGIATWTPRSEWLRLWKPVEVRILQEEVPKPPEPEVVAEPPPPPPSVPVPIKRETVTPRADPPPPVPTPQVETKPVTSEPPPPVMTAAPSAPAVETPAHVVAPQPETPPAAPPAPAPVAAQPSTAPAPRTVARIDYIRGPAPAYPMMSRRLGEQGKVMIKALVDETGHAVNVVVHQSSGRPRLDEAAKKAVMDALFKPYREDGKAEQVYVVVPVIFKLEG